MTTPNEKAAELLIEFLKKRRKELKISQSELAEMIGTSQKQISTIESGNASPSLDLFLKIVGALDCFIFLEEKESNSWNAEFMKNKFKRPNSEN